MKKAAVVLLLLALLFVLGCASTTADQRRGTGFNPPTVDRGHLYGYPDASNLP